MPSIRSRMHAATPSTRAPIATRACHKKTSRLSPLCAAHVDAAKATIRCRPFKQGFREDGTNNRYPYRRLVSGVAAVALSVTLSVTPAHAGVFDKPEEKDPVEPFSVFGSVSKKYVIDVLDEETGRQIVARKKGFTAEACVDVIAERQQRFRVPGEGGSLAPGGLTSAAVALQGASTGSFKSSSEPVARKRVCVTKEVAGSITKTEEMLPACVPACRQACGTSISAYDAEQRKTVGFGFTEKDAAKVKGTCAARCVKECQKSGKAYNFIVPWRL